MSSVNNRAMAPKVSRATLKNLQDFADVGADMGVTNTTPTGFGFDHKNTQSMQLKMSEEGGMASGMAGVQSADAETLEEKEAKKRKDLIRAMGQSTLLNKIDVMIEEVDAEIAKIAAQMGVVQKRIDAHDQPLETEEKEIKEEINGIKTVQQAEEDLDLANQDAAAARADKRNEVDPTRVAALNAREQDAKGRATASAEELQKGKDLLRAKGIDPDSVEKMSGRLDHLQEQLDEIQAKIDANPDRVELERLQARHDGLTETREGLVKLKDHIQDNPNKYKTIGEAVDSMPEAEQEQVNSSFDNVISSSYWSRIEAKLTAAKDAVVNTVTEGVNSLKDATGTVMDAVANTTDAALTSVTAPEANPANKAKMTIQDRLTDEPDPTGDRAPHTANRLDLKANPQTAVAHFNIGGLNNEAALELENTPVPTPAPAPTPGAYA